MKLAPIDKIAESFWRWWIDSLAAFIPPGANRLFSKPQPLILLDSAGDRIFVFEDGHKTDGTTAFYLKKAGFSKKRPVAALIPSEHILQRQLTLPYAAADRLYDAVKYQVHLISPFTESDVCISAEILASDPSLKTIRAGVTIVQKQVLDALTRAWLRLGWTVDRFVHLDDNANFIELVSRDNRARPVWTRRDRALVVVTIILISALFIVPYYRLSAAMARLDDKIASQMPQVAAFKDLRERRDRIAKLFGEVIAERKREYSQLLVLGWLFEVLGPEDWITDYRYENGRLQITGFGANASAIIEKSSEVPEFRAARFSAPVAYESVLQRDRFSIIIELVPPRS